MVVHIDELLNMSDSDRTTYLDDLRKHKRRYTDANKLWRQQYIEGMKKRADEFFKNNPIDLSVYRSERGNN